MAKTPATADKIVDIGLQEELSSSYGRYAHTTILDRAIPDVRDGLKPVQRRILYAMYESKNTADRPYRKSAKTVGDVMGNYHPHGDQSIYDALVRLAQPWKMRLPLIDGHGNFGSIDDDPPAAMRYTEARLAGVAAELMRDIGQNTVAFRPNFDESTLEPTVVPARFPNLLVNGTSGVSTGFATDIPPHNLGEVIEAVCQRIDRPDSSLDAILACLPGPDFPTGGILMGKDDLREAYATGRGRVLVRARHTVEAGDGGKSLIVVSELPYGVVKANLVRDLDQLRQGRAVQGIADVRDESDREGLRLVIELAKGADAEGIWNFLLKKTELQTYIHFNMVAIAAHRPELLGLLPLLDHYIGFRREVLQRRCQFDLDRARARAHIVEGLIRAVDILDAIITAIRASRDRDHARTNLVERFGFSAEQAEAILALRLYRLTNLQIVQLWAEHDELHRQITDLEQLLASARKLDALLKRELREVAQTYADPRRTEIWQDVAELKVALEVRVRPQPVMVAVSARGYIKRSSLQSYQASGGKPEEAGVREGDSPRFVLESNTTHRVLLFSALGQVYSLPVYSLPETRWSEPGVALVQLVDFDMQQDQLVAVFAPAAFRDDRQFVFVTAAGYVKRTPLPEFDLSRTAGAVACRLQGRDRVVCVLAEGLGPSDLLLTSRLGQTIRFPLEQVSIQGRAAQGVRGMGVNADDAIVAAELAPQSDLGDIVLFTTAGKAKRTPLDGYPRQHRAGKGVRGVRALARHPHEVLTVAVSQHEDDTFLLVVAGAPFVRIQTRDLRSSHRDGNVFAIPGMAEDQRLLAALPVLSESDATGDAAGSEATSTAAADAGSAAQDMAAPPESQASPPNDGRQLSLLLPEPDESPE